ncbi:hypothetical protein GCM10009730_55380 [Streptomyces albidochromogenes]
MNFRQGKITTPGPAASGTPEKQPPGWLPHQQAVSLADGTRLNTASDGVPFEENAAPGVYHQA